MENEEGNKKERNKVEKVLEKAVIIRSELEMTVKKDWKEAVRHKHIIYDGTRVKKNINSLTRSSSISFTSGKGNSKLKNFYNLSEKIGNQEDYKKMIKYIRKKKTKGKNKKIIDNITPENRVEFAKNAKTRQNAYHTINKSQMINESEEKKILSKVETNIKNIPVQEYITTIYKEIPVKEENRKEYLGKRYNPEQMKDLMEEIIIKEMPSGKGKKGGKMLKIAVGLLSVRSFLNYYYKLESEGKGGEMWPLVEKVIKSEPSEKIKYCKKFMKKINKLVAENDAKKIKEIKKGVLEQALIMTKTPREVLQENLMYMESHIRTIKEIEVSEMERIQIIKSLGILNPKGKYDEYFKIIGRIIRDKEKEIKEIIEKETKKIYNWKGRRVVKGTLGVCVTRIIYTLMPAIITEYGQKGRERGDIVREISRVLYTQKRAQVDKTEVSFEEIEKISGRIYIKIIEEIKTLDYIEIVEYTNNDGNSCMFMHMKGLEKPIIYTGKSEKWTEESTRYPMTVPPKDWNLYKNGELRDGGYTYNGMGIRNIKNIKIEYAETIGIRFNYPFVSRGEGGGRLVIYDAKVVDIINKIQKEPLKIDYLLLTKMLNNNNLFMDKSEEELKNEILKLKEKKEKLKRLERKLISGLIMFENRLSNTETQEFASSELKQLIKKELATLRNFHRKGKIKDPFIIKNLRYGIYNSNNSNNSNKKRWSKEDNVKLYAAIEPPISFERTPSDDNKGIIVFMKDKYIEAMREMKGKGEDISRIKKWFKRTLPVFRSVKEYMSLTKKELGQIMYKIPGDIINPFLWKDAQVRGKKVMMEIEALEKEIKKDDKNIGNGIYEKYILEHLKVLMKYPNEDKRTAVYELIKLDKENRNNYVLNTYMRINAEYTWDNIEYQYNWNGKQIIYQPMVRDWRGRMYNAASIICHVKSKLIRSVTRDGNNYFVDEEAYNKLIEAIYCNAHNIKLGRAEVYDRITKVDENGNTFTDNLWNRGIDEYMDECDNKYNMVAMYAELIRLNNIQERHMWMSDLLIGKDAPASGLQIGLILGGSQDLYYYKEANIIPKDDGTIGDVYIEIFWRRIAIELEEIFPKTKYGTTLESLREVLSPLDCKVIRKIWKNSIMTLGYGVGYRKWLSKVNEASNKISSDSSEKKDKLHFCVKSLVINRQEAYLKEKMIIRILKGIKVIKRKIKKVKFKIKDDKKKAKEIDKLSKKVRTLNALQKEYIKAKNGIDKGYKKAYLAIMEKEPYFELNRITNKTMKQIEEHTEVQKVKEYLRGKKIGKYSKKVKLNKARLKAMIALGKNLILCAKVKNLTITDKGEYVYSFKGCNMYMGSKMKKIIIIRVKFGKKTKRIRLMQSQSEIDVKKMHQGVSPNLTHFHEGYIAMYVRNKCVEKNIACLTIHDCFSVPLNAVDIVKGYYYTVMLELNYARILSKGVKREETALDKYLYKLSKETGTIYQEVNNILN